MDFKLSAPIEVRIEVTRECNLKCIHCYNDSQEKIENELTHSEFLRVVDQLEKMGAFDVVLGGGEPFLRKDIWDILQYMVGKFKLAVITNGTCIGKTEAKELARIVDFMEISIDSATPHVNDFIRGKGSFNSAVKAIESLVEVGIPTIMSMVPMKQNANEIKKFVRLGEQLGVQTCTISRLQLTGRAKINRSKIALSREEFIKIQEEINSIVLNSPKVEVSRPLYAFPFLFSKPCELPIHKTGLANVECAEGLTILPDGVVIPCAGLPDFVGGNVREKSLKEIWEESPILKRLREVRVKGKCRDCEYFPLCRGGCRGQAYLATGDIEAPDPLCWLFD